MQLARVMLAVAFLCATAVAEAPMVTCKDGTTSKGGRGACRGHGGVDKTKSGTTAPAETAPPAAKTPPPAAKTLPPATPPAAKAPPPAHASAKAPGGKAASDDATGAIAKCKDGMYWHSAAHSGACSHHGGVDSWLDGSQKR